MNVIRNTYILENWPQKVVCRFIRVVHVVDSWIFITETMETKRVVRLCCLSMNVIRETLIFFHRFGRTEPRWWCVISYDSYKSSIHEYSLRKPWKRYASFVSIATIQTSQLRTLLKRVVENRTWKKISVPYGIWTHDLCDTDAALYQLS